MIYVNQALVILHRIKKFSVETSTFEREFDALKTCVDLVKALQYKLRMMGVGLKGPENLHCDNQAIVNNATLQDSTLKKV